MEEKETPEKETEEIKQEIPTPTPSKLSRAMSEN